MILWPTLVTQIAMLIVGGHAVEAVKASPYGAAAAWIPEAAYLVLVGYGLATAVGKQLE